MSERRFVPYGRQTIDEEDIAAVAESLASDFLTTGPKVDEFEAAICEVTGARQAVALSSGTAALHAAYAALGIGPGDELITSPLTFAATSNAALYLGARPVFADVEPGTGTLSALAVADALTPQTKAIVAVDYAGHPADYVALGKLAGEAGIPLVADAAHSLGATDGGTPVGTLTGCSTLSFHPVKQITSGEGGALVTDIPELANHAREFRSHGIARDRARLTRDEGPWYSEMHTLGFNYRLTDIQCALGLSQLRKLPRFLARRREIAERYREAFDDLPFLRKPEIRRGVSPAWHLYVLRVATDPVLRLPFFEALREAGLGVQVHYIPVYRHPYYQERGYEDVSCPVAEDFYSRAISIPIFPGMSDDDVSFVIDAVRDIGSRILS